MLESNIVQNIENMPREKGSLAGSLLFFPLLLLVLVLAVATVGAILGLLVVERFWSALCLLTHWRPQRERCRLVSGREFA
jgi:hypothetical protein